jgi:hypothetical protein
MSKQARTKMAADNVIAVYRDEGRYDEAAEFESQSTESRTSALGIK